MLPKENRIKKKADLARVLRSRIRFKSEILAIKVAYRNDDDPPRIVIAVGKKVSKKAVERNKVTRWLREIIRKDIPNIIQGIDIYISAFTKFENYSFEACKKELNELFKQVRVIDKNK